MIQRGAQQDAAVAAFDNMGQTLKSKGIYFSESGTCERAIQACVSEEVLPACCLVQVYDSEQRQTHSTNRVAPALLELLDVAAAVVTAAAVVAGGAAAVVQAQTPGSQQPLALHQHLAAGSHPACSRHNNLSIIGT
eukprot:scaffold14506_cov22-Tisochrysis_lutea.AAC.1